MSQSNQSMPMSLQGILYQAMSKMSGYDLKMMQDQLQYMIQSARAYGGWSQNGATLNVKSGIVSQLVSETQESASQTGDAIKDEAYGQFAAAGTSFIGAGASVGLGNYTGFDRNLSTSEESAKDTDNFKTNIDQVESDPAGSDPVITAVGEDSEDGEEVSSPAELERRAKGWAGDNADLSNFSKDAKFNRKALTHLKTNNPEAFNKLRSDVNVRREKVTQGFHDQLSQRQNMRVNYASQVTNGLSQTAQAGGHVSQGTAQTASGDYKAEADALQSVQQQWSQQLDSTKQKADGFLEQANSVANGYAQITQTRG